MDLTCEERPSDSPLVTRVWRGTADEAGAFVSMADTQWGMVVTRFQGRLIFTVRGPETRATPAFNPGEAEFFGMHFRPGTLMPNLPPRLMMDRCDVTLPSASSGSFWLDSAAWEFPTYENADVFIDRLERAGLVAYDPVVAAVLEGQPAGTSLRTVQRRFLQATGMTYGMAEQIRRAREAVRLLKQGIPILDVVDAAGYYDQPHLNRAFRQFVGQTPAQILDPNRTTRLSFLYKNTP